MENKNIPIYEFIIDSEREDLGLTTISIVDEPAILVDFLKFEKSNPIQFQIANKEKRELVGPAMIAGMRIYRADEEGEYYGYFSKETIELMHEDFMSKNKISDFSIMHNGQKIEGAFIKECWLTGKVDKSQELGFDLPEGSLMVNVKCSEALWAKIAELDLKGFSIECYANVKRVFNKSCSISDSDLTLTVARKLILDAELEEGKIQLSKDFQFESFNNQCRCSRCSFLRIMGGQLPGVFPEGFTKLHKLN